MEHFRGLLLDVWREVCQHLEIHESTGTLTRMLADVFPLQMLLVRRLEKSSRVLETVAIGLPDSAMSLPIASVRTALSPAKQNRLTGWAGSGKILHSPHAPRSGDLAMLVPEELAGEVLVGPLTCNDDFTGVLVWVASDSKSFDAEHRQMAEALLEPFSIALENDRRLHELITLRESAEADRRSLLRRIGRQEISEEIVGADDGLRHVMGRVQLVSQSDVPVLILGETGTGKEVVSRAIHTRSARSAGPFIRVNCGAIPPELIDSQLFGHEKGSFTGANEMRRGWFERADGGTLFLDEIGELPLAAQVRLLRVLQDGFIERVGGETPIRVDVRIVAATHRDLAEMVTVKTFREDLWYRVSVFPILLPPLRERLEDIPALARHFAQRAANRFSLAYVEPTAEDLSLLANYRWPGNIRELGAVIDRAAILGAGKRLDVETALGISSPIQFSAPSVAAEPTRRSEVERTIFTPISTTAVVTLEEAMRQHIEQALRATGGRIEGRHGAAELLAINPHTLRARMRKLRIDWSRFRP